MLEPSESVAITLDMYDTLMENSNTLDEFVAAIMEGARLSWQKDRLIITEESSRDLMMLFKYKYPTTYASRLDRLQEEAKDDAGNQEG